VGNPAFVWVSLLVIGYALGARRLARSVITAPMVMVAAGAIFGPSVLDLVGLPREPTPRRRALLELALALQLFNAAVRLHLLRREHHWEPPLRLIGIALPLNIMGATALGVALLPRLSLVEALLLAAVLAPGDGEIIRPFMDSPDVPFQVTDTLNLENALSDAPVATVFTLALSVAGLGAFHVTGHWVLFLVRQVGLGGIVGAGVGFGGAKLLDWHTRHGRFTAESRQLAVAALAVFAYAAALQIESSAIVAVSAAGLMLGNYSRTSGDEVLAFAESTGVLTTQMAYALIGALAVAPALELLRWESLAYVGLLLTIGRMVPVALSFLGMRLGRATIASVGWFSPRGLPSALLGMLFLEESSVPNARTLVGLMHLTVLISICVHGMSAYPAARAWRRCREGVAGPPPDASPG
jgi:NhaP-type Na+/H+ or K+/H+ antiporter